MQPGESLGIRVACKNSTGENKGRVIARLPKMEGRKSAEMPTPTPTPTRSDHDRCAPAQKALHACKASLGLLPRQCYKPQGGSCDAEEFDLKRCLAFLYDERDARVLYNPASQRDARVAANQRLQKKLKRFDVPCTP